MGFGSLQPRVSPSARFLCGTQVAEKHARSSSFRAACAGCVLPCRRSAWSMVVSGANMLVFARNKVRGPMTDPWHAPGARRCDDDQGAKGT
jgi:hypothetical protein